jgi:hypothetical protein
VAFYGMTKLTKLQLLHNIAEMRTIVLNAIAILLLFSTALFSQVRIKDLPIPNGCARIVYPDTTFSGWIQLLKLKGDNKIKIYNGTYITDGYFNQSAVVDMPLLFKSDLEQCADFCMRFWAEYHKSRNNLHRLYLFNYSGQKLFYSNSGLEYVAFLKKIFMNTNSFSLKKGCASVQKDSLKPGDMFVQNGNGGVGHVSMIVDECISTGGAKKLYLIGFSFMPAQEFHIEMASDSYGIGGWFTYDGAVQFLENVFTLTPVLRRF